MSEISMQIKNDVRPLQFPVINEQEMDLTPYNLLSMSSKSIMERLDLAKHVEQENKDRFVSKIGSEHVSQSLLKCLRMGGGEKDITVFCDDIFQELPLGLRAHLVTSISSHWDRLVQSQEDAWDLFDNDSSISSSYPLNLWRGGQFGPDECLRRIQDGIESGELNEPRGHALIAAVVGGSGYGTLGALHVPVDSAARPCEIIYMEKNSDADDSMHVDCVETQPSVSPSGCGFNAQRGLSALQWQEWVLEEGSSNKHPGSGSEMAIEDLSSISLMQLRYQSSDKRGQALKPMISTRTGSGHRTYTPRSDDRWQLTGPVRPCLSLRMTSSASPNPAEGASKSLGSRGGAAGARTESGLWYRFPSWGSDDPSPHLIWSGDTLRIGSRIVTPNPTPPSILSNGHSSIDPATAMTPPVGAASRGSWILEVDRVVSVDCHASTGGLVILCEGRWGVGGNDFSTLPADCTAASDLGSPISRGSSNLGAFGPPSPDQGIGLANPNAPPGAHLQAWGRAQNPNQPPGPRGPPSPDHEIGSDSGSLDVSSHLAKHTLKRRYYCVFARSLAGFGGIGHGGRVDVIGVTSLQGPSIEDEEEAAAPSATGSSTPISSHTHDRILLDQTPTSVLMVSCSYGIDTGTGYGLGLMAAVRGTNGLLALVSSGTLSNPGCFQSITVDKITASASANTIPESIIPSPHHLQDTEASTLSHASDAAITAISLSPDTHTLWSGDAHGVVCCWTLPITIPCAERIAMSAGGVRLGGENSMQTAVMSLQAAPSGRHTAASTWDSLYLVGISAQCPLSRPLSADEHSSRPRRQLYVRSQLDCACGNPALYVVRYAGPSIYILRATNLPAFGPSKTHCDPSRFSSDDSQSEGDAMSDEDEGERILESLLSNGGHVIDIDMGAGMLPQHPATGTPDTHQSHPAPAAHSDLSSGRGIRVVSWVHTNLDEYCNRYKSVNMTECSFPTTTQGTTHATVSDHILSDTGTGSYSIESSDVCEMSVDTESSSAASIIPFASSEITNRIAYTGLGSIQFPNGKQTGCQTSAWTSHGEVNLTLPPSIAFCEDSLHIHHPGPSPDLFELLEPMRLSNTIDQALTHTRDLNALFGSPQSPSFLAAKPFLCLWAACAIAPPLGLVTQALISADDSIGRAGVSCDRNSAMHLHPPTAAQTTADLEHQLESWPLAELFELVVHYDDDSSTLHSSSVSVGPIQQQIHSPHRPRHAFGAQPDHGDLDDHDEESRYPYDVIILARPRYRNLLVWLFSTSLDCDTGRMACGREYWIDVALGHNVLCALFLKNCGNKSIAVEHEWQDYLRQYGPHHLRHCNRSLRSLTQGIRKIDETAMLRGALGLPRQIGYISGLQEIYARRVGLQGRLPSELGELQHLRVLSMGNNYLCGELPSSLTRLRKLQRIVLHQNRLSGVVPRGFASLGCIVNLAGNPDLEFGDDVPLSERSALATLYQAAGGDGWLSRSKWCSPRPVSQWYKVGVLDSHVHSIVMSSNNMRGVISSSIGFLPQVPLLHNHTEFSLTNPLHTSLTHASPLQLRMVELATMPMLSGPLPVALCTISTLRRLCICRCGITGPIPDEIGLLTGLEELQLFGNKHTGVVPETIGNLSSLKLLSLGEYTGGNPFQAGPIPPCISRLVGLEALFLSNCNLIGTLPAWLSELKELRQLDLQNNSLTGLLPTALSSLVNLLYLNVKDNPALGGGRQLPLEILTPLTKLNRLSFVNCRFELSHDTLHQLHERFPRCKVWYTPGI